MKLLQLSLRDLVWLMLVAAVLCGWLVDRERLRQRLADLEASREAGRAILIRKLKARLAVGSTTPIRAYGGGEFIEIVPVRP